MTNVERHQAILDEIHKIYVAKNHDYGDSFHQTFLEEGFSMSRIRLTDKLSRFKTLSKAEDQKVSDESMRDTLLDLANYAIMTAMEMDRFKEAEESLSEATNKMVKPQLYHPVGYCACTDGFIGCLGGVSTCSRPCSENDEFIDYGSI